MIFAVFSLLLILAGVGVFISKTIENKNKIILLLLITVFIAFLFFMKICLQGIYFMFFLPSIEDQISQKVQRGNFFQDSLINYTINHENILQKWVSEALQVDQDEFPQSIVFLYSNSNKQALTEALKYLVQHQNSQGRKSYYKQIEKDTELTFSQLQKKINQQIQENALIVIDDIGLGIQKQIAQSTRFNFSYPVLECNICDILIEIWKNTKITLVFASSSQISQLYFQQNNQYVKSVFLQQDEKIQSIYNQISLQNTDPSNDINFIIKEINQIIQKKNDI